MKRSTLAGKSPKPTKCLPLPQIFRRERHWQVTHYADKRLGAGWKSPLYKLMNLTQVAPLCGLVPLPMQKSRTAPQKRYRGGNHRQATASSI
jgi:hypothetical protein